MFENARAGAAPMRAAPNDRSDGTDPGFGVYVHWPFCAAKCPYCDFNSHVRHAPPDQMRYVAAFRREIAHLAALTAPRTATSIFFGGGTPSLMAPATVAAILAAIDEAWPIAIDAEITLEANPSSVEAGRFRGYRTAGVNRVSLGVQALNDADLRALGRIHSAAEAMQAIEIAQATFSRTSFDLIYARPGQTLDLWRQELARALDLGGEHLSLYQLTIEPDTPFERLHRAGRLVVPDDDAAADLFELTGKMTRAHGLERYEISNHARPGGESRHNLIYWRYGDYVGLGPGAHGRPSIEGRKHATATERHPETWLDRVERQGHGLTELSLLDGAQQGDELLLMGLRLEEGVSLAEFERVAGRILPSAHIEALASQGLVAQLPKRRLRATDAGALLLNSLVAELLA